jgi:hypothetical protein
LYSAFHLKNQEDHQPRAILNWIIRLRFFSTYKVQFTLWISLQIHLKHNYYFPKEIFFFL